MRFKGHEITIRWFLGWCRRQRPLVEPTREAARRFYLEKDRSGVAGTHERGNDADLYARHPETRIGREEPAGRVTEQGGGKGRWEIVEAFTR